MIRPTVPIPQHPTTMKQAALLFAAAALAEVHQLKNVEFDAHIGGNRVVLAEFFAPWCGHCKALAPEFEKASAELSERGNNDVSLVKIDCTEEAALCEKYGIEGYPTLKVFRGADNVAPYMGPRKADAIVSYMTKQALPAVSQIRDAASLEEFKAKDSIVIVGFFDDMVANNTFDTVANSLRDHYLFASSSDAALAKKEGVKMPGLVLYKTFDEGKTVLDASFESLAITTWIKGAAQRLLGEIGPDTYAGYMEAGIPLVYIFTEAADKERLIEELTPLAKEYKGKLNFATIDATLFAQHANNLNLNQTWPALAIQDTITGGKYPLDQSLGVSASAVKTFTKDFFAGKIEKSIKSEAVPEQQGAVYVLVAKEYEKVVLDSTKDVLVEFYAPWCGHCKALAPKFEELASMYSAHSGKVVIAKIDATANDIPDQVQAFPTIKLYPAQNKTGAVEYAGDRSVDSFVTFIKEHGSFGIDVSGGMGDIKMEDVSMGSAARAATIVEGVTEAAKTAKKVVEKATDVVKEAAAAAAGGADDDLDHDEL